MESNNITQKNMAIGPLNSDQAIKELAKVAVAYKLLQTGRISLMSNSEFEKFMKWLK
jgi:hypothetical protein